jgi:hypothetical protein
MAVQEPTQVIAAVERTGVGRPLTLTVNRKGSILKVQVVPGEMGPVRPR